MRVLAVRFPDRLHASAVLDVLRRRLNVDPPDVDIAPLGIPGKPAAGETVLAGRFPEEKAAVVAEIVRRWGGEVVANVDERWTRPRRQEPSNRSMGGLARGDLHS